MSRSTINDLLTFITIARERNFTRAAAKLGLSQSALSHTIRALETRLGLQLLTRTTRSVAPTEAGERLLKAVAPHFEGIDAGLAALSELRDKPAGLVRITTAEHAAETILQPVLEKFLPEYPDIQVDVVIDSSLTDIVAGQFDAGIRMGEHLDKDMIAVPIGPDLCMAVVGTPAYFATRPRPETPQDLTSHRCINMRLLTYGGLYAWEFDKDGREVKVRVEGQLTFNTLSSIRWAVLSGLGLAYLPEDYVRAYLEDGRLVRVLENWCHPFPGYHLYFTSRRQPKPAFAKLVDALRYRR
ncbi:LysR family transcriptional regulator [Magnetospirillum fulvum]|uniref:LysR family transcriptional regulator n=1 Tax=Magnetospirillum fulvum MGU-K5 TaxID=1316936 RepID=S9S8W6_MAGFU|nr:LysR family transcriptional regulator [Magnetospirillum fulvum]EPY02362.1 LysR family transcriptional regulator [Magnetospirillum fulvum MGU-K5]